MNPVLKQLFCVNRAASVFFSLSTNKCIKKICFKNHLHAPNQDRLKDKVQDETGVTEQATKKESSAYLK